MLNKRIMIPKIRFSDFKNKWNTTELEKVSSIVMGQSPSGKNYTNNPSDFILVQGNADMKDGLVVPRVWTTEVTRMAKKGSLILSVRAPVGEIGKTNFDVVLGRGVSGIEGNEFIYQSLIRMKSSGYWTRYSTGSTFESINSKSIKEAVIFMPESKEQDKIGEFFKQLDNIITLQQQLLNDHKQLKKAMLQKMFPQKGESIPKTSFDEFSGDWKKQKINDLVTLIVREVPKPKNSYKRLSIRSHAKGTFQRIVEDPTTVAMDKLYLVKENDLIVNITFAWEHAIAIVKKEDNDLLVSHRFPTYVIEKSDINFIKEMVSKESFRRLLWLISPGGAGRNRVLNKKDFGNLGVLVPISIEEQEKIGNFFKQLDETIFLHEKKLETYQELKKAMLQKMFV